MPIYTFQCPYCGYIFEKLVPMNTRTIFCPECEKERHLGNKAEKVMSTCNFVVNGYNESNGYSEDNG